MGQVASVAVAVAVDVDGIQSFFTLMFHNLHDTVYEVSFFNKIDLMVHSFLDLTSSVL